MGSSGFGNQHTVTTVRAAINDLDLAGISAAVQEETVPKKFHLHDDFFGGAGPVSYTHLDVYKRQYKACLGVLAAGMLVLLAGQGFLRAAYPKDAVALHIESGDKALLDGFIVQGLSLIHI